MEETIICNICDKPGTFSHQNEFKKVNSNVKNFKEEAFTVWRCSNCQSLHSKEAVDINPYYDDYPMTKQTLDFATKKSFNNRLKFLTDNGFTKKHSILDYGCGKGLFITFLKEKGFDATGYDPFVTQYSNKETLHHKYDFIYSQDVIEYVSEPQDIVKEYTHLLNKEGVLIIGTPNAEEIELENSKKYHMELHQPYHQHILSKEALVNLCEKKGLKLISVNNRFNYDTLFPMINTQFIKRYIDKAGGFLDAGFEKPKVFMVLSSIELLFYGVLGYFFRSRGNLTAIFKNTN